MPDFCRDFVGLISAFQSLRTLAGLLNSFLPFAIAAMALPFGSKMVPIARDPLSFFTFVATWTNSSPLLTKIVAVPPTWVWTSSTSTNFIEGTIGVVWAWQASP
jgi:hypothetical protein